MYRVALTGNIASGKSAVARAWAERGACIVDADVLARDAVAPGTPGLRAVVDLFGPDVITEDGTLDRARVRHLVFTDERRRRSLERVLHPEIARLREREERRLAEAGERVVVHVIPLLFEAGLEGLADRIVFVDAPAATRLNRLLRDRGLSESQARAMIDAQMPAAQKRHRAHIVIDNDRTLAALAARANRAWDEILAAAEAHSN